MFFFLLQNKIDWLINVHMDTLAEWRLNAGSVTILTREAMSAGDGTGW